MTLSQSPNSASLACLRHSQSVLHLSLFSRCCVLLMRTNLSAQVSSLLWIGVGDSVWGRVSPLTMVQLQRTLMTSCCCCLLGCLLLGSLLACFLLAWFCVMIRATGTT